MSSASAPLKDRYGPEHLEIFTPAERERFLGPSVTASDVAWELLYRLEPDVYERLVAGEWIHPGVFERLPAHVATVIEVGPGPGRLTVPLAARCDQLIAIEPAAPMRDLLTAKLADAAVTNVEIRDGFFDAIPAPDGAAGLVVSCSAFTAEHGDVSLREMERVCGPGGRIAMVWPSDVDWLTERGFSYESFDGEMHHDFASADEAHALARIFYPMAARHIADERLTKVPYDVLGINAPRDIAWKDVP